jgi:hypothetical protein
MTSIADAIFFVTSTLDNSSQLLNLSSTHIKKIRDRMTD